MDLKLRFALAISVILSFVLIAFCWVVYTQVKHQTLIGVRQSLSEHVEHEVRHLSLFKGHDHSEESTLTTKGIYHRVWKDTVLVKDTFPKDMPNLNPEMPSPESNDKIFQYVNRSIDGSRIDIIAYYDLITVKSYLGTLAKVLWLGCVSGFLLILPLSWLLAKVLLQPFRKLAKITRELDIKQLSFRFPAPGKNDEFGALVLSFNSLLERLEKSFLGLRRFATNASHELRTPLTVIHGEAEVALRRKREPKEYETVLKTIRDHSERLQRITTRLLLFADVERMEQETTQSQISIREFLDQIIEDLQRLHPEFERSFEIEGDIMVFKFQQELLMSILTNLIENAIKYSKNKIQIRYQKMGGKLQFWIIDDGEGIEEDQMDQVFEPFFASHNLKRIKGHGLGLSIVKACVEAAQGELKLSRSSQLGGLQVFFSLPLVS